MERLRRWVLLGGFALGVLLVLYVSLSPLVIVTLADFAAEQKNEGHSMFLNRPSEQEQYLRQLSLSEYIGKKTKDRRVVVSGEEWDRFFDQVHESATGTGPVDWLARISPDSHSDKKGFFFRPNETPLSSFRDRWETHGQDLYLFLDLAGRNEYVRLRYQRYGFDDVQLGSGFMRSPKPPPRFLHPFRTLGFWVFGVALALYLFLPGPKREPDDLFYARWRCMLGDVVSLMLFGLFFTLPLFISGGSLQAFVPPGLILVIVLWPLAGMGGFMSYYQGWYAAYTLRILEDRLAVATLNEKGEYRFKDMASFGAVSLRAPRWLVAALSIAALFQKGGARYTAMGQSLSLGGSQHGGLGIQLKDASTLYIWITDQMGGHALKAANRITAAMKAAGVPEEKEPRVIHALVPPTFEAPGQKKSSRGARFLMVLALLPFVGIGVMVGVTAFPRTWRTIQTLLKPDTMSQNAKPAIPAWVHPSLEWYSDLGLETGGNSHRGGVLCATRDGGAVLTVQNMIGQDAGFLVVRTDGRGNPLWQTSCGTEQWDYAETILETHDGGCLVVGGTRPEIGFSGTTRAYLVRLGPSGQMNWDILLGGREDNDWGDSAIQRPDGGCVAAGLSEGSVCIFHLDEKGALLSEKRFRAGTQETDEPKTVLLDDGFNLLIAGVTLSPGVGFKDLYVMKLDSEGNSLWRATAGGKHLESPARIRKTSDGGYLVVGVTRSFGGGGEDVYLVKVNGAGVVLWERAFGAEGEERGVDVIETGDGAYVVLAWADATEPALRHILLVKTDLDGTGVKEIRLTREEHYLTPASLAETEDGGLLITGSCNRSGYLADHAFLARVRFP